MPKRWEILVYALAIVGGLAIGYVAYVSLFGTGASQAPLPAAEYRVNAIRGFNELNATFMLFGDNATIAELGAADEAVRTATRTKWNDASKRMTGAVSAFRGLRPPAQQASINERLLKMADFSEKYYAAIAALVAKVDSAQLDASKPAFATEVGTINAMKQAWWASPELAAANAALEELKAAK